MVAFASYFDVYSHAHIFVGIDPWWNPAHVILYAGFAVVAYGIVRGKPAGIAGRLSTWGVVIVLVAAGFNEIWHRVLLFGNPIPEPFPVEPPHALLAVGLIMLGVASLVYALDERTVLPSAYDMAAVGFTCGSLWLIVVGSAFYVGTAYASQAAYFFAIGVASFSASLFLAYPPALRRRFGYATLAYLWFLFVFYLFFISPVEGLPFGIGLVLVIDFMLIRGRIAGINSRFFVLPSIAVLYGIVYYPILPIGITLAVNGGLVASSLGVVAEYIAERSFVRSWLARAGSS